MLVAGGVCYFGCGNRLVLFDGEYGLPLLSLLPPKLSSLYLRALGRGNEYYERHQFYWQLRRLVAEFELTDFTWKVLLDPERFDSDAQLPRWMRVFRHIPAPLLRLLTPLLPTYIWVLTARKVVA